MMYKSFLKRQESDKELQTMQNRLRKLQKDVQKSERAIETQEAKNKKFRKARELFNKDLKTKMAEKRKRMELLRKENDRIRQLYLQT